jgi:hypothetical protein
MVAPNDPISAAAAAASAAAVSAAFSATSGPGEAAAEAAGGAGAPRKVSRRKRRANRRNAKQSTGPRTPQGKVRASRNSTTHGIFCRDLILPGEDAEMFHLTRNSFIGALKPQDAVQLALVDSAVSARWRMNRCQRAEGDLIAQRTARAVKRCAQRLDALKRNLRCEDFSAAAIAAQCQRSEVYGRYFQEFKDLNATLRANGHPGHAIAALMQDPASDQPLERLSRYEHRLEHSFHRCLRDLHVLKKLAKAYADEPDSPFLGRTVVVEDEADDGGAPGRGLGVPPEHCDAAAEKSEKNELGRDAQATDRPRAHAGDSAPVQNEPTAKNSVASPGPADGSDDRAAPELDPDEMEELQKLTDRLSRSRDTAVPDDDADAYDP